MAFPIILAISLAFIPYLILVMALFTGWRRTRPFAPSDHPPFLRVSVLIPCRNESSHIRELAEALKVQDYPPELLQVVWIDDRSTDGTAELLERIQSECVNHILVRNPDTCAGKKGALKTGMQSANGDLILLTDADSRPGPLWVRTMAAFHSATGADLIIGPVAVDPGGIPSGPAQQLDFLSLAATAAGSCGIGRPVLAHGPNMGVRAADYRVLVNSLNDRFASGDDIFLLQSMKKIPAKSIRYLLNREAIITTPASNSLKSFLRQRIRWASKTGGYDDPFLILTTWLVFLANLAIVVSLIGGIAGWIPFRIFAILLAAKILADLPLLLAAMKFFRCNYLSIWILPTQILYPAYVILTGLLSRTKSIRWKA